MTIALEPVTPPMYGDLFRLALEAGNSWPWPTPAHSFEQFQASVWHDVLEQAALVSANGVLVGVVAAYSPNFAHGYAYWRLHVLAAHRRTVEPILAAATFLDGVLAGSTFRKLYFECSAVEWAQYQSIERYGFVVEGRYAEHFYSNGRYVDRLVVAIRREAWAAMRAHGGLTRPACRASG